MIEQANSNKKWQLGKIQIMLLKHYLRKLQDKEVCICHMLQLVL